MKDVVVNDKTYCLLLSENCNFACKYCYERSGKGHSKNNMSIEVAKDVLNYAFDHNEKEVVLSLFGGEPTMNPSVIDMLCTDGKKLAKERGMSFNVGIITNGSLMNRNLYDILKKHIDIIKDVQLSIDGNKKTQDTTRVKVDGSGSFDDVSKCVPYWKALFPGLSIHGVLNKDSMGDLFNNYKFFLEEWGVSYLWFLPAKDDRYTKEDVEIYDTEMGKITNYIMNDIKDSNSLNLLQAYQPLNIALNERSKLSKPCGIGDNYQVITTKGDIWPCHHLYFIDTANDTKMGSIYEGVDPSKSRIWEEYDAEDMIGCEGCELTHCFRCPAENYEANGSPFVQVTGISCEFMFVDTKYQKQIKKDLIEMGLLKGCDEKCGGCDIGSNVRDYDDVSESKTGCDVVERIMADVSESKTGCDVVERIMADEPTEDTGTPVVSDANTNLKNLLNDMIGVMVSYHNKL